MTRTWNPIVRMALATPLVAAAFPVLAQQAGDPMVGRHLAETWCSGCHVVVPNPPRGVSNGAPSFAAVANMKSTTLMSLEVFLQSPHPPMPDLRLARGEIDDVAGYILSLRAK